MAVGDLEIGILLQEDVRWIDGDSFQIGYEVVSDGVRDAAHHLGKTLPNNVFMQKFFVEYGEEQAEEHVCVMGKQLKMFPAKKK